MILSDRLSLLIAPVLVAVAVHLIFLFLLNSNGPRPTENLIVATPKAINAKLVSDFRFDHEKQKNDPSIIENSIATDALLPRVVKNAPIRPDLIRQQLPPLPDLNNSSTSDLFRDYVADLKGDTLDGIKGSLQMDDSIDVEEEKYLQVAGAVRQRVTKNWRLPPSARNGMQVVLLIQLVPTGEVIGITVLSSSGSSPFDSSAVSAVERIGRFPEVANLSNAEFEKYFRNFPLRFKPEDLRY